MSEYAKSGVDIDAGEETVSRIKDRVKETYSSAVLTGIGSFGALYGLKDIMNKYRDPVLVQSIDGVGTKLIVAELMKDYSGVGKDIVNHSCNDILAMGARPLTFLDYVAHQKLIPEVMEKMVIGMVEACKENNVSLIGGETAEMPGVYLNGQHDIAGCITGIVDKDKIITGEKITAGDIVFGFASNGLHTNGYSLARKVLFETAGFEVHSKIPELGETVGEALIKPHTNYINPVLKMLDEGVNIKSIAHITGGGFNNITRVLPKNCNVIVNKGSWPILPIFDVIKVKGNVSEEEMYKVFNMGIGLVLVISKQEVDRMQNVLKNFPEFQIFEIGKVEDGGGEVLLK